MVHSALLWRNELTWGWGAMEEVRCHFTSVSIELVHVQRGIHHYLMFFYTSILEHLLRHAHISLWSYIWWERLCLGLALHDSYSWCLIKHDVMKLSRFRLIIKLHHSSHHTFESAEHLYKEINHFSRISFAHKNGIRNMRDQTSADIIEPTDISCYLYERHLIRTHRK